MYLAINENFHSPINRPIITDKEYVAYDILMTADETNYRGHYHSQKILFSELNIAIMEKINFSCLSAGFINPNFSDTIFVTQGYHSFLTKEDTEKDIKEHLTSKSKKIARIVPVIIPKGAKVFFGERGDIAANEIIYVKDEETLKKHYPDATYLSESYKKFIKETSLA